MSARSGQEYTRGRGRGRGRGGREQQQRPKSAFDQMLSEKYAPAEAFQISVTLKQYNQTSPTKVFIEATDTKTSTTFSTQIVFSGNFEQLKTELENQTNTKLHLVKSGDDDSHAYLINCNRAIERLRLVNTKDNEYRALYALFDVRLKTHSRHRYHIGHRSISEPEAAAASTEPETVVSARYQSGLNIPIGARHQYEAYLQHKAVLTQSGPMNMTKPLTDENENAFCALHNGHVRFKLINKQTRKFYATLLSGRPESVCFYVVPHGYTCDTHKEPVAIVPSYKVTDTSTFEMAPYDSLYFEHSGEGPYTTVLVSALQDD